MPKSSTGPQTEERIAAPTSESETSSSPSAAVAYDRDRVASRAYELYMQRGGGDGNDMDDWFAAEREFSTNGDFEAAENLRDSGD